MKHSLHQPITIDQNGKTNKLSNWELKWLEEKETNPSLLYVRELKGKNVNEDSHTLPIRQPSPGPTHVHGATQMLPIVIYITNGIINDWGDPSFKSFKGLNSHSTSCFAHYMNMWFGIAFNMF